jgi:hypothetical protein
MLDRSEKPAGKFISILVHWYNKNLTNINRDQHSIIRFLRIEFENGVLCDTCKWLSTQNLSLDKVEPSTS